VKEPAKGLGRAFSSLLLQNIPEHLEAIDLFLNVFDSTDNAAEIEMHTHEDGTPTGTAQMYFEREGAAEAAQRKHNGQIVEGRPLRMLVIKAVSKQGGKASARAPSPPKRKRDASQSPPRKPQVPSKQAEVKEQPRKLSRSEPPLVKPALTKPLVKPEVRKPARDPLVVKPKTAARPNSQIAWAVDDNDQFGFAEHDEPDVHRPEVVRPRLTKPKEPVQVVQRDGRPHQVYLSKNKEKYNR
jgi:hypothetical protein